MSSEMNGSQWPGELEMYQYFVSYNTERTSVIRACQDMRGFSPSNDPAIGFCNMIRLEDFPNKACPESQDRQSLLRSRPKSQITMTHDKSLGLFPITSISTFS